MNLKFKSLLLLSMAAVAGMMMVSCETKEPDNPSDGTDVDQNGNTFVTTECITPIRYCEGGYEGTETGVSVIITQKASDNVKFILEPGSDINSYLVQIYPMAFMYNTLLEEMHLQGKESFTVDETTSLLASAVRLTEETSGGELFTRESLGEDFASYEFDFKSLDWTGMASMAAGTDFLIVVQACFDDAASRYGDLVICHFKSSDAEITGEPSVSITASPGLTSYSFTLTPGNEACASAYYLSVDTPQLDEYIDAYGEDMLMQYMLYAGAPVEISTSAPYSHPSISVTDLEATYAVCAIPCDPAGNPYFAGFVRRDFSLQEIPDDAAPAKASVSFGDMTKDVAATVAKFTWKLGTDCKDVYYNVYTKEEAESYMNVSDEEKQSVINKIALEGFSVPRPSSSQQGSEYELLDLASELTPDTEYALLFVGRNFYNQFTELEMSDVFKTDPLVRDRPEDCIAHYDMKVETYSRTALVLSFTYDENTALIMHRNAFPVIPDNGYNFPKEISETYRYDRDPEAGDGEGWLYWFLDFRHDDPYHTRWPDMIQALTIQPSSALGPIRVSGYDSGRTYDFAYIAEDINGVLGPVKTVSGTTMSEGGGDNPLITSVSTTDGIDEGQFNVVFNANEDTREMRYMAIQQSSSHAGFMYLEQLINSPSASDYETYISEWSTYIMNPDSGLSTTGLEAIVGPLPKGNFTLAVALPIGGAEGADPVYGDLAAYVIDEEGNVMTVEEYLGVQTKTVRFVVPRY